MVFVFRLFYPDYRVGVRQTLRPPFKISSFSFRACIVVKVFLSLRPSPSPPLLACIPPLRRQAATRRTINIIATSRCLLCQLLLLFSFFSFFYTRQWDEALSHHNQWRPAMPPIAVSSLLTRSCQVRPKLTAKMGKRESQGICQGGRVGAKLWLTLSPPPPPPANLKAAFKS